MATVKIGKMDTTGRKLRLKDTSVKIKRFRDADGKVQTLRTIDAHSKTLSNDITYVFARNVEAARQENKRITGFADFEPIKR